MDDSNELKAMIFDVQSFSTHDGPGIRTNVFFKGCSLRCLWCANPESQKFKPELFYTKMKCVGCMMCARSCPYGAVTSITDPDEVAKWGYVRHDRTKCIDCEEKPCIRTCFQDALSCAGELMTVEDVMKKIRRDSMVYRNKGGVTVSGGDPLLYPEFVAELLRQCQEEGFNTCLESELCVPTKNLEMVMPYIDIYFTDCKIVDESQHIRATGASNKMILQNLALIGRECPERMCVRIPIIPGYTDSDENIEAIANMCLQNHFKMVNILPYHKLGSSKYERLGRDYPVPDVKPPTDAQMMHIANIFAAHEIICKIN